MVHINQYSLEGLMLKLKLQSFGHLWPTWCEELTHLKGPWCWGRLRPEGEGDNRGLDGWIASPNQWTCFGWTLGVGEGQGGLAYCGSWGLKESDTTEQLNWIELNWTPKSVVCIRSSLLYHLGCYVMHYEFLYLLLSHVRHHRAGKKIGIGKRIHASE